MNGSRGGTVIRNSLIVLALLVLAGCATNRAGDFCLVSSPIQPSSADTLAEGTARQILAHNEYGEATCRWRP